MVSIIEQGSSRPARPLHGLVALSGLRKMKTGATRSIRLTTSPLRDRGIYLHFVAVRSIIHFLYSLSQTKRFQYDFALFNGLASISHSSRFGYALWQIVQALHIPTFIYWHEADWVLDRYRRENPTSAQRVDRIASHESVVHLTASDACSASIRNRYAEAQPITIYECSSVPAPFDQPATPTEPPLVVNLASIQERKGVDLFVETAIRVCRQHPTAEFMWLGDGKPFGTWQTDIQEAGLQDRILFPGYVDSAYLLLRRASILFLSSRDDPFPLSVLEAMCLGRTIVAFDIGGAPEALAGHGTLVPPFDTEAAADAILAGLSLPPQERIDLALRNRYLDLYSPEKFAARLNEHIRERISHEQ